MLGLLLNQMKKHDSCRVAVNAGALNCLYVFHKLRAVAERSNDCMHNGLEEGWMGLPSTKREAARSESLVGGQNDKV